MSCYCSFSLVHIADWLESLKGSALICCGPEVMTQARLDVVFEVPLFLPECVHH